MFYESFNRPFSRTFDFNCFCPRNADFRYNFYTAQDLNCVGFDADKLSCVGFINGVSLEIVEIKTELVNDEIVTHIELIKGDGLKPKTLNCELL